MSRQNGPVIFDLDQTELPDVATPAEAPPVPEPGEAALGALTISAGRPSGFARLFWGSLGGLGLLGLGVTASDFILGLFERAPWLGWIGAGLAGALALLLLSLALREMAALSRLGRIEKL
ncbi:MAG: TIGR01620 family protein, partial [Pseudomonadota bacterium]